MAAALAVLKHLKTQGATLQQQLNQRTSQFVAALNAYFEEDEVPVRMAHFGSLFGPASAENPASEFCCLRKYGLVTLSPARWSSPPGGGGYLSTAHTDEDIDYIIQAVKDSVAELREGGLLALF